MSVTAKACRVHAVSVRTAHMITPAAVLFPRRDAIQHEASRAAQRSSLQKSESRSGDVQQEKGLARKVCRVAIIRSWERKEKKGEVIQFGEANRGE